MAILLQSLVPLCLKAQSEYFDKPIKQKELLISTSLSYARYRDFATSPLFYQGRGTNLYMGWQSRNENGEFNLGLDFLINLTLANAPKSDFYEVKTMGIFSGLQGNVTYLRNLKQIKFDQYDFKVGGTLVGNQNMRLNPSLDNSSTGLESIVNLMLSAKVDRDISRRNESVTNFLFLSIRSKPVKRTLTFQTDVGILNFNRRPSYSYAYTSPIDGTNTSMFSYVWDKYSWSMNGWRLRSKLEFTQFKSSGNGHKIAYTWDAMHAPGKYAAFQAAMHRFEYTILINNNR
jgi:hypothetical protein